MPQPRGLAILRSVQTRLERLLASIVDLGFAPREQLDALALEWSRSLLTDEATFDDDDETTGLLAFLQTRGVLSPPQLRGLLAILGESGAPTPSDGAGPGEGRRYGTYVTEGKLGEGAMGKIYRARRTDQAGPGSYVVKVFSCVETDEDRERIRREGDLLARIQHPNVVRCYGGGREGEEFFLAMEFVDGETLQALMERRRRLPWEGATRAVGQIAQALRVIHAQGIVHRDVKPHNVLVARDGTLKLCDFGLAKASEAVQVRSRAGMILGSPAYIAPEQWGDHDVDTRADLFALGVVFYFLVTGVFPFRGRTPADFALRIQQGDFPPLENLAPGIPPALSFVVTQLLERDRRYRTPTAAGLIDDLARILQGKIPNVPRLESPGGALLALVGRDVYRIGSNPKCELWLDRPELSPVHAQLERALNGLLLRTVDEAAWVEVNGQRAQGEIPLKPDDEVRFDGNEAWTFVAGNMAIGGPKRSRPRSDVYSTLPAREEGEQLLLPALTLDALVDGGHELALLACIEELDARRLTALAARSQTVALSAGLSADLARRAQLRARQIGVRRREWLANCLFHATYENLGPEVDAWLTWWGDARERYPVQARPLRPRQEASLEVETPSGRERVKLSGEREEWTLGRSLQAEISIRDVSVSRVHARIFRLGSGYAFRDLGSRQGVRVGGERRDLGALIPGDSLQLGRIQATFSLSEEERADSQGPRWIDRLTFTALVELRAPQVLGALVALVDSERLLARLAPQLAPCAPNATSQLLEPFLSSQRQLALEALGPIAGVELGDDPADWRAWWARSAPQFPEQLAPRGWEL